MAVHRHVAATLGEGGSEASPGGEGNADTSGAVAVTGRAASRIKA
jgi:hypothetical protein